MTTDPGSDRTHPDDRAARIAALEQRSAAARPANRTVEPGQPRTGAATRGSPLRVRRRHAAAGGRILVGSLSAAATLVLVAAMASASAGDTGDAAPLPAAAPAPPTVIVVSNAPDVRSPAAASAAPAVAATSSRPVATSRAS